MDQVVIALIAIIAIIGFVYFNPAIDNSQVFNFQLASVGDIEAQETQETNSTETVPINSVTYNTAQSSTQATPKLLIDTFITKGPEQGEIITGKTQVEFEFTAKTESSALAYFETKLIGYDKDWILVSGNKRTINLEPGLKTYTFLVRAKVQNELDPTPAQRYFIMNTSQSYGKIIISHINPANSNNKSLIRLTPNLSQNESLNITGWSLENQKGEKIYIPQGIEKYLHYYAANTQTDIIAKYGDTIYLSSDYNPLGNDSNFKPNKCTGYLEKSFDFPVSLPLDCPRPESEEISHLSSKCKLFIFNLATCQIPDYSENVDIRGDSSCTQYIDENLNHYDCFQKHFNNTDFISKDWYIFLNGKDIIQEDDCDTLYLKDKSGLVVDTYSYGPWWFCY